MAQEQNAPLKKFHIDEEWLFLENLCGLYMFARELAEDSDDRIYLLNKATEIQRKLSDRLVKIAASHLEDFKGDGGE